MMSRNLQRWWNRAARPTLQHAKQRLFTPAQWPWRNIAIGAGICTACAAGVWETERRRRLKLQQLRQFVPGSPLESFEGGLRTGDVLLFNRTVM
jgi:hypothetical protein